MYSSIIVAVISVIGSFVLVYLTVIKERFDIKNNVRKEQLEKFYIPFYRAYCAGFLSITRLGDTDKNTRSIFLDLLTNNIHLMEPVSQSMYQSFYRAYLNILEAESGNPDFLIEECKHELDECFDKLSKAIFNEYRYILKKCHLPVPLSRDL